MVGSINSSNSITLQSGIYQKPSLKTTILSNKTKDENPFVQKMEKPPSNLDAAAFHKIELASDKLSKTFSTLNKGAPGEDESEEHDVTAMENNTESKRKEMASKSRSEINATTLNSAIRLYTILKGDILLTNHFDFKTGSVNFFA